MLSNLAKLFTLCGTWQGIWKGEGVYNVEQLDPDPFMERIGDMGLPWQMVELDPDDDPLADS